MNVVKAHARWLTGKNSIACKLWEVSHPQTTVTMWTALPHDTAKQLIERFVLSKLQAK